LQLVGSVFGLARTYDQQWFASALGLGGLASFTAETNGGSLLGITGSQNPAQSPDHSERM
jgi:hypothetical protein